LKDEKLEEAFEKWTSKVYPLTVPLRVVALKYSVPPAWIKVCSDICVFFVSFLVRMLFNIHDNRFIAYFETRRILFNLKEGDLS